MPGIIKKIEACCPDCAWQDENYDPDELEVLEELNEILLLEDAGKRIDPDTLTDRKWIALGEIKRVRIELAHEEAKREGADGSK